MDLIDRCESRKAARRHTARPTRPRRVRLARRGQEKLQDWIKSHGLFAEVITRRQEQILRKSCDNASKAVIFSAVTTNPTPI